MGCARGGGSGVTGDTDRGEGRGGGGRGGKVGGGGATLCILSTGIPAGHDPTKAGSQIIPKGSPKTTTTTKKNSPCHLWPRPATPPHKWL